MSFLNQLALNIFFYYFKYFFNTLSNTILSLNHLYFFVNRMKSTKSCYLKKNPIKYLFTQYWIVVFQFDSAWTHWKIGGTERYHPRHFYCRGGGDILQRIFIIIFNRTFLCHDIDNKTKSAIIRYFGWLFVCHPSTYF